MCVGTMALEAQFNGIFIDHMLSQVMKRIAYPNPMPSQNKRSPSATTYNCNIQDCGDLLDIFGGLQIYELKLAKDDHELTKVYF